MAPRPRDLTEQPSEQGEVNGGRKDHSHEHGRVPRAQLASLSVASSGYVGPLGRRQGAGSWEALLLVGALSGLPTAVVAPRV